jgi:hypothetical protein
MDVLHIVIFFGVCTRVCVFIYDVALLHKQGVRLFSDSSYTHFLVFSPPLGVMSLCF